MEEQTFNHPYNDMKTFVQRIHTGKTFILFFGYVEIREEVIALALLNGTQFMSAFGVHILSIIFQYAEIADTTQLELDICTEGLSYIVNVILLTGEHGAMCFKTLVTRFKQCKEYRSFCKVYNIIAFSRWQSPLGDHWVPGYT